MTPFNDTETGFTPTALTLSNSNAQQGMSFPTWGNPERHALTEAAAAANLIEFSEGY